MPSNTVADFVLPDPRNVPADYYRNVPAIDPRVNTLVKNYVSEKKLKANQNDPSALNDITSYLRSQGINAQTDYRDVNGHTGGILVADATGKLRPYQLIDGSNNWTNLQAWPEYAGAPSPTPTPLLSNAAMPAAAPTRPNLYLNPGGEFYTGNVRDYLAV